MHLTVTITDTDGVWHAKEKALGIDQEIVPLEYSLADLPNILAKIEETLRTKAAKDFNTKAPIQVLQTEIKISVGYDVRSPRDRSLGEFDSAPEPEEEEDPADEVALLLEGEQTPLLTEGEVDLQALAIELDQAAEAANGGILTILYEEVLMTLGAAALRMHAKGDLTVEQIRDQITSFRAEAGACCEEVADAT